MLKHVQISPLRNRADSVSLRSSTSSCASSMCGSPEPPADLQRTPSRASSYSSLSEQLPQTTIKVFTNCLKIDIEYKTLGIQWDTTSREVITQLLRRLKLRHRDRRLFYLSMEVMVRRAGVKTVLVLDDDTRPAILQACHPKGESRFCLQLKPGGLIRIHTSALQPNSQYKSLVISEETTSDELLQLLLSCYKSLEPVEQFSIYEVCPGQEYQRKLHPDDLPLRAQAERMKRGETCHFLVRRNPNYAHRRQLLSSLNEVVQHYNAPAAAVSSTNDTDNSSLLDMSIESLADDLHSLMTTSDEDDSVSSLSSHSSTSGSSDTSSDSSTTTHRTPTNLSVMPLKRSMSSITRGGVCSKCRNNFKSCEFCHKNSTLIQLQRHAAAATASAAASGKPTDNATVKVQTQMATYNPVYNIREIRTASHSFSSLGNDKKLLDIQLNAHFEPACRMRPQSMCVNGLATRMIMDANANNAKAQVADLNGNNNNNAASTTTASSASATTSVVAAAATIAGEAVYNNPAKGLGHFVYL